MGSTIMKISIVTITRNDGKLLQRNLDSLYSQQLEKGDEIEHIIVNAQDGSPVTAPQSKVFTYPSDGIYNAINRGLSHTTGDVIGVVHGNDFLADKCVLNRVSDTFRKYTPDFVYGDVEFVSDAHPGVVYRHYGAADFKPGHLLAGFAPPHPSLFISRHTLEKVGHYKTDYRIAGDFEYFVRLFCKHDLTSRYIPHVAVRMETGGESASFFSSSVTGTREKYRALRENGLKVSMLRIVCRIFFYIRHKKL